MYTVCSGNDSLWQLWIPNHGFSTCFIDLLFPTLMLFVIILSAVNLLYIMSKIEKMAVISKPRHPHLHSIFIIGIILVIFQYVTVLVIRIFLLKVSVSLTWCISTTFSGLSWVTTILLMKTEIFIISNIESRPNRHTLIFTSFFIITILYECTPIINLAFSAPQFNSITVLWILRLITVVLLFILSVIGPGFPYVSNKIETLPLISEKKGELSWSKAWPTLKKIWPFIWPKNNYDLQGRVFIGVVCLGIGRFATVIVPILNKEVIDQVAIPGNFPWKLISLYCLAYFTKSGVINNLRTYTWIRVQQYTARRTMVGLFEHLHSLSLRWHVGRKTGEILRIIDRGNAGISQLFSYVVFNILPTVIDIFIATGYFIFAFNIWFGALVFFSMTIYVYVTFVVTEWRSKYRKQMNADENVVRAKAVDSLLNFETVKYFNAEDDESSRYLSLFKKFQASEWKSTATLSMLGFLQAVIINIGLFAGCLLCAHYIAIGDLTPGDYVLFTTYILQLYGPLNFLGRYYRMLQQSFIDLENMLSLMDEKPEITDNISAITLSESKGHLVFEDVHFSYLPMQPILRGISFELKPGQTLAIVGPSGSGKSTIVRLIFRLYSIDKGSIKIDGIDITSAKISSLRDKLGVVPQDTVLFNDTIFYNIHFGRLSATDEEVYEAARVADIHNRIMSFPSGYDTIVGERGLRLSGGEKQRIAIARTILRAPPIVLLDEATSALDTKTERNIQQALERVCVGRSALVVAHRLSTVVKADEIIVLKDGVIAERGTHIQLLEINNIYAEMWTQQQESQEDDINNSF